MAAHFVVTGAGGFVGGYLARSLASLGYMVTAISRRSIDCLAAVDRLTWRQADLRKAGSLPSRFDALLHVAAEIPARCRDSVALYESNLQAADNVFGEALRAGANAVVFTSSMSVYGRIEVPIVTEDTPANDPDPYGRAKRDAETLLETGVRRGLYSGLSIRLPGTVGKGSHNNFLSDALRKVQAGEAVSVNNPGSMFNNIVYVGDLARFLGRWVAAPGQGYAVTNLAADDPLRIYDVVELLFETAGRPTQITVSESGKKSFLISLDRARSLGYRPGTVHGSVRAFVRDNLAL
jgi:nucleoside-diphosphate-sugar epimerase